MHKLQEAAFAALKEGVKLATPVEAIIAEIQSVKPRHRSHQYLDDVLEILKSRQYH